MTARNTRHLLSTLETIDTYVHTKPALHNLQLSIGDSQDAISASSTNIIILPEIL
jgi:hypothetical protein